MGQWTINQHFNLTLSAVLPWIIQKYGIILVSMWSQDRIEKILKYAILAGIITLMVIVFSQKIEFTAVDLGRHLENGKVIWQNKQVLFKNLYSYTEPNFSFVNHHWLAGVIYYGLFLFGGFKLLSVFNILIILATFLLAFKLAQKKAGFYLPALLAVPVIFLLSERIEVRPEIFSYLFIILTWFVLERVGETKKYRLLTWLIPLFILWANVHIYFFIGLALVGFKVVAEFLPFFISARGNLKNRFQESFAQTKVWFKNLGLLFIACLINPNFFQGLIYPFNILRNYGYEIAENKSVFYLEHLMINPHIPLFKMLLILLIISFAAIWFFSKKIRFFELFVTLFFSALALMAIRNISMFALSALILISANLIYPLAYLTDNVSGLRREIINKYRIYLASGVLLLVLIGIFYLWIDSHRTNIFIKNSLGWGLSQGSADSLKFYKDNKLDGPIFNNYDLGSALIYWLYPEESVFVDNRPEAYSNDFFDDIYKPMQLERKSWLKYSEKYQLKTIYFSHTDSTPWAQTFLASTLDENWALVYFDRYTIIFLNKNKYDAAVINNLSLNNQALRERLRSLVVGADLKSKLQLASFALLMHEPDLAEEIYREVIYSYPNNGLALSLLASVYASSQDRGALIKSLDYFQRGLETGQVLPEIYNQIGLVNWRLGDYKKAEAAWHSALKIERKNVAALYYLEQIRQLKLQGRIQ